jgi:hypothetical protein
MYSLVTFFCNTDPAARGTDHFFAQVFGETRIMYTPDGSDPGSASGHSE